MAQLYNELAEKELIKQFRHDNSWLGEVKAKPEWVSNDVIKIPKRGLAPRVLINNNIYPILTNPRNDGFITVSLNKYETENTEVTLNELRTLPYEKLSDVQLQHRETLEDDTARHALYSIAPDTETSSIPILVCTGPVNPVTGQKRLTTADLINLWGILGDLNVPLTGRKIKLTTQHAQDLIYEDSLRSTAWGQQWLKGQIPASHMGFDLWVNAYHPNYVKVSNIWTKTAHDSIVDGMVASSVVYFLPSVVKAPGTVMRHAVEASMNTATRKNEIGFTMWHVCVGIKDEGFGAIVSDLP